MAKLNSGTRIYGTANIDTQINIGANVVANTTGFGSGTINATSNGFLATATTISLGNTSVNVAITVAIVAVGATFISNTTATVVTTPLTANASTGTSGQVLVSNGTVGSPYWSSVATIGSGQTWTDVKASRATGTTYTNSTGRPIMVVVGPTAAAGVSGVFNISSVAVASITSTGSAASLFSFIIPNGVTYSVTNTASYVVSTWYELR